jgi:hypothetical protein
MIAGAAPPQAVIEGAERIGVNLTHVYGLTEVYGPATVCAKHSIPSSVALSTRSSGSEEARRNEKAEAALSSTRIGTCL